MISTYNTIYLYTSGKGVNNTNNPIGEGLHEKQSKSWKSVQD